MNKLLAIQSELKVPKSQHNSFGNYDYRSKEDILEALKPLLAKYECSCWITDSIVQMGNRYYVKSVVTFVDGDFKTIAEGWAREDESQKGMQGPQVSGSSSSYAGKYALSNLFMLDDGADSDRLNKHDEPAKTEVYKTENHKPEPKRDIQNSEPKTTIDMVSDVKPTKSPNYFQIVLANGLKIGCGVHTAAEATKAKEAGHKVSIEYSPNEKGYLTVISLVEVLSEQEVPF